MEGPWIRGTSGGGCHVKRASPPLECTAFPGDCGIMSVGHWWSQPRCEYKGGVRCSVTRQGGAAMWGGPLRLLSAQPSLGTVETDQWAIDDHNPRANINGGSVGPWHVRWGLPCEESHSASRVHSLPWGVWRMTNRPLMITPPVRI